jgi:putative DNA primase/helicase
LYNLVTGELEDHSPEFYTEVQLPIEYDPDAECPVWDRFIGTTFYEDDWELAWEIVAYLMAPDNTFKKAFMCLGEGNNGKSVFLHGLTAFLGKENVSGIPLQALESDRFSRASIVGKLANICADLPAIELEGSSTFKQVTGGDSISIERKFQERFEYMPYTRFIFSANRPPKTPDSSSAFFDRWIVVEFPYEFTVESEGYDKHLREKLAAPCELSGLFNKAITAWMKLQQTQQFTISERAKKALIDFQAATDPFAVWLNINTLTDENAYVRKTDLFNAYMREAKSNGWPLLSANMFTRSLKRVKPNILEIQRSQENKREWYWRGIELIDRDNTANTLEL